jgi:hypothetical protein
MDKQMLPCECRYQVRRFCRRARLIALPRFPAPPSLLLTRPLSGPSQICLYCYDRIKEDASKNKCPNCRKPYSEAPTKQTLAQYRSARTASLCVARPPPGRLAPPAAPPAPAPPPHLTLFHPLPHPRRAPQPRNEALLRRRRVARQARRGGGARRRLRGRGAARRAARG